MYAKKIKIFLTINHFYIPIPAMRFKTIIFFIRIAIKHMDQNKFDKELIKTYMNELFETLSMSEPFELLDVEVADDKGQYKVKIKTI